MTADIDLGSLENRGRKIAGTHGGEQLGFAVAAAGYFNGDGIDDFVISGSSPDPRHRIGAAFVIFGTGQPLLPPVNLSHLPPARGFTITGPAGFDGLAFNVASAGDVDSDGYDDLVIGAPRYDDGYEQGVGPTRYTGSGYVLYGHAGPGHDVALGQTSDRVMTLFEGAPAYDVNGAGPELGAGAEGIGDINGDGREDFAISAPVDSRIAREGGRLYVVYGGAALGDTLDLDALTPAQGFSIAGTDKALRAGISFAGPGDVNGDGVDDLALVSRDPNDDASVSVLFGKAGGLQSRAVGPIDPADGFRVVDGNGGRYLTQVSDAGDVNGDGYADILVSEDQRVSVVFGKAGGFGTVNLSALRPVDGFAIVASEGSPTTRVAAAGDLNGDGYDDVALFNYGYYSGYTSIGYVIYGHGGAFGTIDARAMDAATGFTIRGAQAEDVAGGALASAGDVNDDGVDDLLIGAQDGGTYHRGATYLIYGETPDAAVTRIGTAADQRLAGGAGGDGLAGLGGDDILYGNGGVDRFDGGDGDDLLNGGAGADQMAGGLGNDVYRVDSAGDVVTEGLKAGRDTVEASVDWVLGKNVEALVLGRGAAMGTGNTLANDLTGNAGANMLKGLGGDDRLVGAGGDDVLIGGVGRDTLTGGGADLFRFDPGDSAASFAGADTVIDFTQGEHDRLMLLSGGADPFAFIGKAAFSGAGGEVRYAFSGPNTTVMIDADGDKKADMDIRLNGHVALTAADFAFTAATPVGAARVADWHAPTPALPHLDTMHWVQLA